MRVLSSVVDPRMGGPQRRSLDVANALTGRGIETAFLIPEGDDEFDEAATAASFETHRIPISRPRSPTNVKGNLDFLGRFLQRTRQTTSLLREESFDVVHANTSTNFQTALAATWADVPLVWHFNDTLTPTPMRQIAAAAGIRWADQLVVAADAVHDYYFSQSVSSQTIYAPVDLGRFDPDDIDVDFDALRRDLGISSDGPIVGTIGNLSPVKGHEYLLRAIAALDGRPDVVVPIVGGQLDSRERYHDRLQELRSTLGLEDVVTFVGFRSDIPQLLSVFDLFVLPSVAEACPIVVLEAMAMETPIIATDVGGVSEQLPGQDHGWVVPPRDVGALAGAISDALSSPSQRTERAANARARVREVFSLEACVDRHVWAYECAVSDD